MIAATSMSDFDDVLATDSLLLLLLLLMMMMVMVVLKNST